MKLLQTLIEAAAKSSTKQTSAIVGDSAQIKALAATVAKHLKKTFGEKLLDTPMAIITQHARSCIDSKLSTKLSKDDLEKVTDKVLSQLKSHLKEGAADQPDDKQVQKLTKTVVAYLKKAFGKELLDQPMAVITQHTRSQVDAALKSKLSKDELESITSKVLSQLKAHLKENEDELTEELDTAAPAKSVTESVDTVSGVMSDIINDSLDLEEVMMHPHTPGQRAAAKVIQRMYDECARENGLDGQDDFDQILPKVSRQIESKYGNAANNSQVKEAASKEADDDTKKVSTKALAKSMEDDGEDGEDDDAKKADSASKDAPKKIVDTSIKPEELKSANAKLPKQIAASLDSYSVKSAFELNKKLRADFPDITSEQLKQASVIWKSDNT